MRNVSWREGCPVSLDALSMIRMTHWRYDGSREWGTLIVAKHVAADVRDVFRHAYNWGFAIDHMNPVHIYGGDDDRSMAANNTSAFNCRSVSGGTSWSEHSFGTAIDINPIQNPYVTGRGVFPPAGQVHTQRDAEVTGLIRDPGPLLGAFSRLGWGWGGHWRKSKDYQHFSVSGR
jgi:poly-gamma-glutamate synthesis protein (capsule biosynthesis protein)